MPWLADVRPDLLERYRRTYQRSYAPTQERRRIHGLVRDLVREHGGPVDGGSDRSPRNVRSDRHQATSDPSPAHQLPLDGL